MCAHLYKRMRDVRGGRRFAARSVALALLLGFQVASAASAEDSGWIEEPLFGLYYYPNVAHFGSIRTQDLLPACRKALADIEPLPSSLTLYARHEADSARLYIAGTGDNLAIYVLRDGTCTKGVPIIAILQRHHNPPLPDEGPSISDAEVTALFADALNRYARAFGGKDGFFRWLDSLTAKMRAGCEGKPENSCPPTYHILQPELQKMLQDFRRQ